MKLAMTVVPAEPRNPAPYPHPALRATFSRKREKGFFPRARSGRAAPRNGAERPLSRLRERVGVRAALRSSRLSLPRRRSILQFRQDFGDHLLAVDDLAEEAFAVEIAILVDRHVHQDVRLHRGGDGQAVQGGGEAFRIEL